MKKGNVEKLEEIFKGFDEKGTGKISTNDLTKLISSAKIPANQIDIIELEKCVDPDHIGEFDMKAFVNVVVKFSQKSLEDDKQDELIKAFSFFDEEKSGFITQKDLKKIMSAFGEPINQEQTKQILKYAKAVNGKINYQQFAEMMIKEQNQEKN